MKEENMIPVSCPNCGYWENVNEKVFDNGVVRYSCPDCERLNKKISGGG